MRDLHHTHMKASYMLEAFAGVKISNKEGLPGQHKDFQVSYAT